MIKVGFVAYKTTISLPDRVGEWGEQMADRRGFGENFSAYVADLIRRDHERWRESSAAERIASEAAALVLREQQLKNK